MQLNLTPEEEKLAKKALTQEGQTLEEAFMSFVYLKLAENQDDGYPEFPDLGDESEHLKMQVNEDGVFEFPENAPEHIKELLKFAE